MKTVYQLVCSGSLINFNGTKAISSKKVFLKRENAEMYKNEFIQLCTNSTDKVQSLTNLDPDGLKIKILELELIDDYMPIRFIPKTS